MRASEIYETAVEDLKNRLPKLKSHTYDSIDNLMQDISFRHRITGKKLHDLFVHKYGHTPDTWIKKLKDRLEERGVAEGSEPDAYGRTGEKHECGSCDGTGIDTHDDECSECGGKGWVRDKESLKKQGMAEATGDEKFDTMMGRMTAEPKYPDKEMPPTSIPELIQWAHENRKKYHEYFAGWARKNKFTNVNDALEWFGDNVDPSNPWGPKDRIDVFGRPAAEELQDAAKHDPKAAELMTVYACYEEIVFDWPDDYRQMNMPDSRKGTDEGVAEGMAGKVLFRGTGDNGGTYEIIQSGPNDYMIHANGKHIDTYGSLQRAMSVLQNEVPGLTKGVAEDAGDSQIKPGMKTQYGTVVSVKGNTVTVRASNGELTTVNIHDIKQGMAEGTKTGDPVYIEGCEWDDVVNWLVKNVGPITKKNPNYAQGYEGRGWILYPTNRTDEEGLEVLELSANTKLANKQVLAKRIQMACSGQQGVAEEESEGAIQRKQYPEYYKHRDSGTIFRTQNADGQRMDITPDDEEWDDHYKQQFKDMPTPNDGGFWNSDNTAAYVEEDWNKVNKKDKTSGMSQKAVNAYRRENPGSKLKTAVTTKPSKLKKGSKAANRRKSFCARMGGNKGPMKKPNGKPTPKALALRRWNCESIEELQELVMLAEQFVNKKKNESI